MNPKTDKRSLSKNVCAALILWLAGLQVYAAGDITAYENAVKAEPGLVSFYTFDSNANDVVGSNNGTLQGTTSFTTGVAGGTDKALLVAGNGWVNVGAPAFDFTNGTGTVELWLRGDWTSSPGYSPCPFADRSGSVTTYSFYLDGAGKANIGDYNGNNFVSKNFPAPLGLGIWHHLAVVFNSGTWTLIVDGVNCGTVNQPLGAAASAFQIGTWNYPNSSSSWIGALDEVAVYTNALTLAQVQAHYNAFVAPPQILAQSAKGTNVVEAGVPLQLSLTMAPNSSPSFDYQWYKNGGSLTGSTNNSLKFASVTASDAAVYTCVVTNLSGSVTSSPVRLQVGNLGSAMASYEAAVKAEPSLISFYNFDNFSVSDSEGTNNGTLVGNAGFTTGLGGGPDKALLLDGSGWVNLGAVPAFDFTNGVGTVELWLRGDWSSGYGPCPFADRNETNTTYSFYVDGVAKVNIGDYNGNNFISHDFTTPLGQGVWHHLAVVFDSGSWTLIVDGQNVGTVNQGLGALHSTFQIGSGFPDGNSPWIGAEDEVAIYSSALTLAQVQAHYNAYASGAAPVIATEPVGDYVLSGLPYSLSIGASGQSLNYQWYKNNAPISGANMSSLNFASLTSTNAATYICVVSNSYGAVTSSPAILQVGTSVSPAVSNYDAAVSAEPNLISYYKFDDLTPNDYVSGNNGTLQGPTAFVPGIGGGPDQALSLPGTGWANLGMVPALDYYDAGTIELWARADWATGALTYSPTLVADRSNSSANYSVYMTSGKDSIHFYDGSTETAIAIPNAGTNWHQIAIILSPGTWTLMFDGQNVGSESDNLNGNTSSSQIGSWNPNGGSPWVGDLDRVAYYSTSLTASQVQAHYLAFLESISINLNITLAPGGGVVLSWPSNGVNAVLQQESDLTANAWTTVTNQVQLINGTNQVTVTPESGNKFYRLVN